MFSCFHLYLFIFIFRVCFFPLNLWFNFKYVKYLHYLKSKLYTLVNWKSWFNPTLFHPFFTFLRIHSFLIYSSCVYFYRSKHLCVCVCVCGYVWKWHMHILISFYTKDALSVSCSFYLILYCRGLSILSHWDLHCSSLGLYSTLIRRCSIVHLISLPRMSI